MLVVFSEDQFIDVYGIHPKDENELGWREFLLT